MFNIFSILQFIFLSVMTKILILFSFKVLSNSPSFSPSPLTFQAAYLNPSTISEPSFWNNPSGCFLWDQSVFRISPEWFISPDQGNSSGRIATLSSEQSRFRMALSPLVMKHLYSYDLVVIASFVVQWYTSRKWGWLLCRKSYSTAHTAFQIESTVISTVLSDLTQLKSATEVRWWLTYFRFKNWHKNIKF
jgi:hypothetical protein